MSCTEMPAPTDQHRKMEALAGTWVGEEKIYPSPWDPTGGTATARVTSRVDMDGFWLVTDYVQERGGQISYRGHGVIGYDAGQKEYTMHWFDSMGSPCSTPARGTWQGNVLTFSQEGPMGHGRYIYTLTGEGRYGFRIENSQDGKSWSPFMESVFTKR